MSRNHRRGLVALTTVACLAIMASPASAETLTGTVTAGTLTLINTTGTLTDTVPLGSTGTLGTGCANSVVAATNYSTTTGVTTWQITTFATVSRFKLSTTWYIADLTRTASTAGTVTSVTSTSATLNASTLTLRFDVFSATDQTNTGTSCAHGTTRTCRFSSVNLSLQGTYSGFISLPGISDTDSLSSTGTLGTTSPPCSAPFTSYSGGTAIVTGLVTHVTGVTCP